MVTALSVQLSDHSFSKPITRSDPMIIVADENIPFVDEAFSQFGTVIKRPGRQITNADLRNATLLLVRSVTQVDQRLLNNTSVRFVGSATIGFDHIDTAYLQQEGIGYATAPGCNATAAAEYVVAVLLACAPRLSVPFSALSVGILGYGNVGKRVYQKLEALDLTLRVCDPLINQADYPSIEFVDLNQLFFADIVTLHVPLTKTGDFPTYHLFSEKMLVAMKDEALLINASRGSVVETSALAARLKQGRLMAALDVWENEPSIDTYLLSLIALATPHIAGYSFDGRVMGTQMVLDAVSHFLKQPATWHAEPYLAEKVALKAVVGEDFQQIATALVQQVFAIERDDLELRKVTELADTDRAAYFDQLRKNYPLRREFSRYLVDTTAMSSDTVARIQQLGFSVNG